MVLLLQTDLQKIVYTFFLFIFLYEELRNEIGSVFVGLQKPTNQFFYVPYFYTKTKENFDVKFFQWITVIK